MKPSRKRHNIGQSELEIGTVNIRPLIKDGIWLGWGDIRVEGVPVRDGSRRGFVEIVNPWGVELLNFKVKKQRSLTDGGVEINFFCELRENSLMEWMNHSVRQRTNTSLKRECHVAAKTSLRLILRPVERDFGWVSMTGFSYQFQYRSQDVPIYRMLDRNTWEIGGEATGNTIWMVHGHAPCIREIKSLATCYSTEWYVPSITQPNIIQFYPLQTAFQGFTLTTHPQGSLATWATEPAHIRTLIEKRRNEDCISHFHEHCSDLDYSLTTSPVEVLFTPVSLDRAGTLNLHHEIKELVSRTLHEKTGIRRERVSTYGQIEEWSDADLKDYRKRGLQMLKDAGCKTIFLANHFRNNMNTYGVGTMCCTLDYQVAEDVGESNLRDFCSSAKKEGIKVHMWGNTSISSLALIASNLNGRGKRIEPLPVSGSIMEIVRREPQAFLRNPSGAIEADHYTPFFCCLNLRNTRIMKYWLERWREAHEKIGLTGIFLDSSFNLSCDKFHWVYNPNAVHRQGIPGEDNSCDGIRPEKEQDSSILSQYHAYLSMIAKMQKTGYIFSGEDQGVFGINRSGGFTPSRIESLPMWENSVSFFEPGLLSSSGHDPDNIFFQGLAFRMIWILTWEPKSGSLFWSAKDRIPPSEWQISMLKIYSEVEPLMFNRRILPMETGVLYSDNAGSKHVLWNFSSQTVRTSPHSSVKTMGRESIVHEKTNSFDAEPLTVYLISGEVL